MGTETIVEKAIRLAGGASSVAYALGIHRSTPVQWVNRGRVPAEVCRDLEALTGRAVTCEELRPDVFRPAQDFEEA